MRKTTGFLLAGLVVALLLAGVVSNFASGAPDGLDSASTKGCTTNADGEITGGTCIAQGARDHELGDSPLADYGVRGVDNGFLATGLAGVAGVLLTFAVAGGLFWLTRSRRPAPSASPGGPAAPGSVGGPAPSASAGGPAAPGSVGGPAPSPSAGSDLSASGSRPAPGVPTARE